METALAALVVVFIIIFAILTLSGTVMNTQDMLHVRWEETQLRLQEQSGTSLSIANTRTHAGAQAEITVKNTGNVKLTDFNQWDVIVQYYDGSSPAGYHVAWLPYTTTLVGGSQWRLGGIFSDAARNITEAYEPGILNPGEEAVLDVQLNPPVGAGSYVEIVVSAPNGSETSTVFERNVPPALKTNSIIHVNNGETVLISQSDLETTDVDNTPADLVYTLTTPPTQGTLSLGDTFTQADINNGKLEYANTGTQPDSFIFSVSDGQDSVGSFTTSIAVNMPPTLAVNAGLNLPAGTSALIGDLMLKASDVDNAASELVFTVTTPPTMGQLSMSTFTQADIDNALLSYAHTGNGPGTDSFSFTISDGRKQIGPFTFNITAL